MKFHNNPEGRKEGKQQNGFVLTLKSTMKSGRFGALSFALASEPTKTTCRAEETRKPYYFGNAYSTLSPFSAS